jgi:hypothetical protein
MFISRLFRTVLIRLAVLQFLLAGFCVSAFADAPTPVISLPPNIGVPAESGGGRFLENGYVVEEYFFGGTARAFTNVGWLLADGKWNVKPSGTTAPYKVRMVVYKPSDPARFNGTVLTEWFNVSAGAEGGADLTILWEEIVRRGYAYVGVGVQWVGVESPNEPLFSDGGRIIGSLKKTDPQRYGSLSHPGDSFSYDIFAQAAQAIRHPNGVNPLSGLQPKRVIALGESQSSWRLITYINAVHPLTKVYDGFLVHSRANGSDPLSQRAVAGLLGGLNLPLTSPATPDINTPATVKIRPDLNVPVFVLQTETDIAQNAYSQADTSKYREWELAGAAHADSYVLGSGLGNSHDLTAWECGAANSTVPINAGPHTYGARAAIRQLDKWVQFGTEPPRSPRVTRTLVNQIKRDPATGMAMGGVRLPDVTVPTRTLTGARGLGGSVFCILSGQTDPWNHNSDPWDGVFGDPSPTPEPNLQTLYPTRQAFFNKYMNATNKAITDGFLLSEDWMDFMNWAASADISQ